MEILELTATLYSSLANTGLKNYIIYVKDTIGKINSKDNIKAKNSPSQEKLNEALEILNSISSIGIGELNYILEKEENLTDKEQEIVNEYYKAIGLLREAKNLGDTFSICLLLLEDSFKGGIYGILKEGKKIEDYEDLYWHMLTINGTIGDIQKNIYAHQEAIQEAAEKGNNYAQYYIGKILISQGNTDRGLSYLKQAFLQGNMNAGYELSQFYYDKGGDSYKQFLNPAIKAGNLNAINLKGEILWREGKVEEAKNIFKILAEKGNHKRGFINFMLRENNSLERDKIFGEYVKNDELNREELLSYGKISLSKLYKKVYGRIIREIAQQVRNISDIKINEEEILEIIFYQRNLSVEKKGEPVLGIYDPNDDSIGIDSFLHLEGLIKNDPYVYLILKHTLGHEIIHRISRKANPNFNIPRFLDEGITTRLEEFILNDDSFGYPQERLIFKKLVEYSGVKEELLFGYFLKGTSWYIKLLLDKYLDKIIEYFKNESEFKEIIEEMERYKESL